MRTAGRISATLRRRDPSRSAARAVVVARGLLVVVAGAIGAAASGSACSSEDHRSASWEYLSPALFQPNCATVSCHSRATAVAGLDFSDPERGYTSLTGLEVSVTDPSGPPGGGGNLRALVTPFVPAQSRVVNMLRARAAPRMPPDRPLPEVDIRLVEQWILNGARRSVGGAPDARVADAAAESRNADLDARNDGLPVGDGASEQPADGRSDSSEAAPADGAGGRGSPADAGAGADGVDAAPADAPSASAGAGTGLP